MPSYVITGASRGLGWEFLRQLSSDSNNIVIGMVRNKHATDTRVSEELQARSNIHILQADISDYGAMQNAAEETAHITGGGLDYLIANAGMVAGFDAFDPIGILGKQPEALEHNLMQAFKINVVSNIHLFNLFTPLILKGEAKKVIAISSGHADLNITAKFNIDVSAVYAITKASLNIAVAKFSAQYAKDGVLFMSICPGVVDTGRYASATEEQLKAVSRMTKSFKEYAPHFKGPASPESSVRDVLSVINNSSVENGDGGSFVSHKGNQQWL
ncbi:hypothetical protein BGW36DRAFT_377747 [Talaromyces proteolyticus]|uniref:Short chain dehydrogenase n=1 Tax=Talaromyces proteolyticus TaxID=1131652 RepID=A0AAD4PVQ3_9EURO|nr:uncharacterized protein BGW36DRAFT_377747 [Talaromyces proteolyticus]KAH8697005.1 hypothetical protein BGW36DRAFT_377747 [Talaromyces proteolyticus]